MIAKRLGIVFAFLLVTAVPIWDALFAGQAIGEFDAVRHMAPWNGPAPDQPWDVLQADSVLQFYPWRHMVLDAWGKHQLPLWNPYELAGTPLLANSQSGGFYPPHIVLGLLHVPTAFAMALLAWFHLTLAGLGVYALARRLGAGRLGAFVGGSSFSLSVFMLEWTALPSVPSTVAWIPWLLAGICSIFDSETRILRIPWLGVAGTAFSAAMMILAGHLQFAAYGFMAAILFALGFAIKDVRKRPRPTGVAAASFLAALILGGAMASPQLLPVLQFSKLSWRQNAPSAQGYESYVAGAIKPFELANLTIPSALGSPREAVKVDDRTFSAYWPLLAKQGANLAESAVTIGPLVMGLLFLVPWRRKELWIVAAMAVLALLLALGTPLNALLYYGVPGWSATGSPDRIIVLFVLGACVLAAVAVDHAHAVPGYRRLAVLVLPLVIGLCLTPLAGLAPDAGRAQQLVDVLRGAATGEAFSSLALAVLLAGIGLAILLFPRAAKYRMGLAVFPLVIAWSGYASNIVPTGDPLPITESTDMARVAIVNTNWSIPIAPNAIYPPNTASLSGLHEIGGYDSLLDGAAVRLMERIDRTDPSRPDTGPAPPENGNMMFVKPSLDRAQLAEAGVTKIYWPPPGGGLTDYRVENLPGPGRITGGEIVEDGYDHQTITLAPGASSVIERDRNLPGWVNAWDGYPLGGSVWREIRPLPNQPKIELLYVPPGLRLGMTVGVLGWILAAVCVAFGAGKGRPVLPQGPEAAKITSNSNEG